MVKNVNEFLIKKPITNSETLHKVYYNNVTDHYYVNIELLDLFDELFKNNTEFYKCEINEKRELIEDAFKDNYHASIRPATDIRYDENDKHYLKYASCNDDLFNQRYKFVKNISADQFSIDYWLKQNWK